ncbi:SRPBCC family protein [Streptomyces sp. NBC_00201]|uniref:SRPBCC family protein n=1 Tax=unclassified Streptomyces TaxID=2593676 RepID=UPI00224D0EF3|nr:MULTISPECIES: SRPBCC family protein [unclassified Streptomyces]MCX5064143.1 SRPBCC family protein [Streptomyces sp. NBC_00452]MCX5251563.1 SRPBCC family protein [Streptomyces sp. NBC_00201]MCX5294513.1 SRPBCC family protein [Streptomyces sp. NBC_00183]
MSGQFEAVVEVDRPVEEVFAYLADGRNDPQFSPRVLRIDRVPDTETAVGTVFRSSVKDAGMKTAREFRITELEAPAKIRWAEESKNTVMVREGGYDLAALGDGRTRVRIFNVLEGHGLGKVVVSLALAAARKDADAFGARIKTAAEAAIGPR